MRTLIALAGQLQSGAISIEEFRIAVIACIERMTVNDVLALAMLINESEVEEILDECVC
jgi:hypothetical protein